MELYSSHNVLVDCLSDPQRSEFTSLPKIWLKSFRPELPTYMNPLGSFLTLVMVVKPNCIQKSLSSLIGDWRQYDTYCMTVDFCRKARSHLSTRSCHYLYDLC